MLPSLQEMLPRIKAPSLPTLASFQSKLPTFGEQPSAGGPGAMPAGLSKEQQEFWLRRLARQSGQFIENLGLALDTPGAIARGVLAGDPASGFNFDSDARVSGAELLDAYGINIENPYIRTAAGLGTEIVTDPLFWLSGPTRAVTEAGYAAKEAGLLKEAPVAFMQKYGVDAAEDTMRGKYISSLFDNNFVPKTPGNYQAVSPVGQRLAQSKVTLEDVVNAGSDPAEALQKVVTKLGMGDDDYGLSEYERLKGDTLGGLFGINAGSFNMAFAPPGSETVLDAMDYLGARTRFSPLGRVATGLFDKRTGGAVDTGDQIASLRASALEDLHRRQGQELATAHNLLLTKVQLPDAAQQLLKSDSLYSTQGNDMLVRLAEGKGNATDQQILNMTPGLQEWLDSWHSISNRQFSERKAMGLKGAFYKDKYGTRYLPRYGDEMDFGDMARGTGRMQFSAAEAEAYGRRSWLKTPGGTDDLRQISLLPEIVEYSKKKSTVTDLDAAEAIRRWFETNYPAEPLGQMQQITKQLPNGQTQVVDTIHPQVIKIARTMRRRAEDLPEGTPIFAAHPANTMARRIVGHEIAKSRVAFLLEALSEAAIEGANTSMPGRFRNLGKSWDEIASKAGFQMGKRQLANNATNALKAAIHKATGKPLANIDLSQYSIAEPVVRRLQKIADFYSEPTAQKAVSDYLDKWTTLFKGFVLATPRRFVRDLYSNAVSGFLETGSVTKQLSGMSAASSIVNGDYDSAMSALRAIPKYAALGDDELIRDAFIKDVGGNGVLSGLQSSELLSTAREGRMGQLIPGSTPTSVAKGLAELLPDGSTTFTQKVQNFGKIYGVSDTYDTHNPILRASTTINDTIDSIGRLGTYIALLQQGVDPTEAAARVKRALVDYQSLTMTERKWLRSVFPWWAYNSRIGKYAVDSLLSKPGGAYGQMIRASNTLQQAGDETYIPENLRQKFAVRVPEEWAQALGISQPNTDTYVSDIDLPGIDVLNLIDPNGVQGTINNLATQTAPPIQAAMSMATGRDLFFDRPLDETTTPADRVYKALTGSPEGLSPAVKVGVGLIPGLQVPLNIAGTLADERIEDPRVRVAKAAVNIGSGLKWATVDERYLLQDLQQKIAKELAGKTYTMQKAYIPEELEPTLTERERAIWELSKIKAKRARQIQELRRQQEQRQRQMQPAQMPYPF